MTTTTWCQGWVCPWYRQGSVCLHRGREQDLESGGVTQKPTWLTGVLSERDRDLRLSACKPSCGSVTDYGTRGTESWSAGITHPAALPDLEDRGIGVTVAWEAHRSIDSFWANSRQSLPRELGASRLLQIFWRMDSGILKA